MNTLQYQRDNLIKPKIMSFLFNEYSNGITHDCLYSELSHMNFSRFDIDLSLDELAINHDIQLINKRNQLIITLHSKLLPT